MKSFQEKQSHGISQPFERLLIIFYLLATLFVQDQEINIRKIQSQTCSE